MNTNYIKFSMEKSIDILKRTPHMVETLFRGTNQDWVYKGINKTEWTPYEILAHLIYNEKVNWIPRVKRILVDNEKEFDPFIQDLFLKELNYNRLNEMLIEFKKIRKENINILRDFNLNPSKLKQTAIHPGLGVVNLQQLISTWVIHDMSHFSQILRIMSHQYKEEVGPWIKFLRILHH